MRCSMRQRRPIRIDQRDDGDRAGADAVAAAGAECRVQHRRGATADLKPEPDGAGITGFAAAATGDAAMLDAFRADMRDLP